jgi:hypothetical protein
MRKPVSTEGYASSYLSRQLDEKGSRINSGSPVTVSPLRGGTLGWM